MQLNNFKSNIPDTFRNSVHIKIVPGVGLMVKVVSLGSEDSKFKSCFAVELIPGGVDSACHPFEVG